MKKKIVATVEMSDDEYADFRLKCFNEEIQNCTGWLIFTRNGQIKVGIRHDDNEAGSYPLIVELEELFKEEDAEFRPILLKWLNKMVKALEKQEHAEAGRV